MKISDIKIDLPTEPIPPKTINPRKFLMYGNPKSGKTNVAAGLPNNLIVDFEGGTDYIETLKFPCTSWQMAKALLMKLRKGHTYEYITLDTVSSLEEILVPYATTIYMKAPSRARSFNPVTDNILHLPKGTGYLYLRQAFFSVVKSFSKVTDRLILIAHIQDKMIEKGGQDLSHSEISLTGKIRSILAADVDAIAYFERRGTEGFFRFATVDEVICGARPLHLRNCEIKISELEEDETVTTHWDKIFLPDKKSEVELELSA